MPHPSPSLLKTPILGGRKLHLAREQDREREVGWEAVGPVHSLPDHELCLELKGHPLSAGNHERFMREQELRVMSAI